VQFLQNGINFLKEIFERRALIYELSKRDFKQRYVGSFLGLFWAFLEPLTMMLIMWFVFSIGFKAKPSGDVPFVAYLFTGMIAFNFFQDTLGASSNVIRSYSYLVQKVKFRVSILPILKINSALVLHLVFIQIVMVILFISGIRPSVFWFQAIYYLAASMFLILGLSWLLSAIGVFVQDISHIVAIFLRLGFWVTPIFWDLKMIPERYRFFLKINPIFYIVQGYRESFIYQVPVWDHPVITLYFWLVASMMFLMGVFVFLRLRPHFADVL
jgi:lipopolysaccharide transport system permease protein/teichoic acid transport system permease protein